MEAERAGALAKSIASELISVVRPIFTGQDLLWIIDEDDIAANVSLLTGLTTLFQRVMGFLFLSLAVIYAVAQPASRMMGVSLSKILRPLLTSPQARWGTMHRLCQ